MPHLTHIDALSDAEISHLFVQSSHYLQQLRHKQPSPQPLKGRTIFNFFCEHSTRTVASFELAAKRLGASTINVNAVTSSVNKGESILDTIRTFEAMHADAIVMRVQEEGQPYAIAQNVDCAIINAGDGTHEHPSQALLDCFTLQQHWRCEGLDFSGKTVLICGDILHSRVANSNIALLKRLGASIMLCGPKDFLPKETKTHDFDAAIPQADAIMMLRVQKERAATHIADTSSYHAQYGLTHDRLQMAKAHAVILHPGPMNRGIEIASTVADNPARSLILTQIEAGVAMRQAILTWSCHA